MEFTNALPKILELACFLSVEYLNNIKSWDY